MVKSPRSQSIYNILSKGRLLRFKKGQVIFSSDDSDLFMVVVRGFVKRYFITNNGSLGVQIIYGPYDVFPLSRMYRELLGQSLYDGPETYYYETMSDVQLFSMDAAAFAAEVQQNPVLYKELYAEAGHHLKTCIHSIENISLGNAYARVAHQLLFFAKEFGEESQEGIKLLMPLTHQDIAHILGMSRETVTKSIVKLREEGLISENRRFAVLDMQGLEDAAYH